MRLSDRRVCHARELLSCPNHGGRRLVSGAGSVGASGKMRTLASLVAAFVAKACLFAQEAPSQEAIRGLESLSASRGDGIDLEQLYSGSYALLVGVSHYDVPAAWPTLESVPGELDSLAQALKQAGFEQVEQVRDPTGFELQQSIQEFMRRFGYKPDTRLFFFFSGHGYSLDDQTKGYFVPRDAPDPVEDEAGFRATALSMQQVSTWAGELVARHALFAFDSCFSGTIFRTRNRLQPSRITALTRKPVRQFLSAGGAGETVPARSVFTPMFVRGLAGAGDLDSDGYVTGVELFNYVQREVISYRTGQTPQFGTVRDPRFDEGDIVFEVPESAVSVTRNDGQRPSDSGLSVPEAEGEAPRQVPAVAEVELGPPRISSDVARRTLESRRVAWSAASIAGALSAVDSELLVLFLRAGAKPGLFLEALGGNASDGRSAAETFFGRAKGDVRAISWLRSVLAAGLDPNATIRGPYYASEGLLNAAVRAGNADAILALLDAGASPHAYQDLWLTSSPTARFLEPFDSIVNHDTLTETEKRSILERYLAAGAVWPDVGGLRTRKSSQMMSLAKTREALEGRFGLSPAMSSSLALQGTLCERFSERDPATDWCAFVRTLPARVFVPPGESNKAYHDFWELRLQGLLNVVEGRAYLLGVEQKSESEGNLDVVEISRDGGSWRVYRYMGARAAMGHCHKDRNGFQPEQCWRRISMTYSAETNEMLVEGFYRYGVELANPALQAAAMKRAGATKAAKAKSESERAVLARDAAERAVATRAARWKARVNPKDGLGYVRIRSGSFEMGCSLGDPDCETSESPRHRVTISRDFWIGQTEVTVGAYSRFVSEGKRRPTRLEGSEDVSLPVTRVDWNDAAAFCLWSGGRLPTEAEWEYAARGGSEAARYGEIETVAWYEANSGAQAHPVGEKQPNAFGLYDTLGNVAEWVADWGGSTYEAEPVSRDPQGPSSGLGRSIRGGSWRVWPQYVRVSARNQVSPDFESSEIGFRCVRDSG